MRTALRYHGGKYMLANWIISFLPEHRIYVEPFGGGASVLLRKKRAYSEVYNDLDEEIVNFFTVLRDHGDELKRRLSLTPFARKEFVASHEPTDDPIERARRTVVRSFMGFGSDSIWQRSGFRANANRNGTVPAHDWKNYADSLHELTERMRGVVIDCRPAVEVIKQQDTEKTLFYVDPPYLHSTRTSGKRYGHEMTEDQHRELAEVLKAVKGKVVLSGYDSELYKELYGEWGVEQKTAFADGARKRTELLWFNFQVKQDLFS